MHSSPIINPQCRSRPDIYARLYTTTGRRRVNDEWAFPVRGSTLVHGQEVVVVNAPRVLEQHQKFPDIVVGPFLNGREDNGIRQRNGGAQALPNLLHFVFGHHVGALRTLLLARPKDKDGFTIFRLLIRICGLFRAQAGGPARETGRF